MRSLRATTASACGWTRRTCRRALRPRRRSRRSGSTSGSTRSLARSLGVYSRYADDLTFSGDALPTRALFQATAGIVREEGFRLAAGKTRVRTRAGRQLVGGAVVNERLNVARPEYDRLKAILHDASLHGPQAANRAGVPDLRAHLAGRIAWVASLHPERGRRLQARFERIEAWRRL